MATTKTHSAPPAKHQSAPKTQPKHHEPTRADTKPKEPITPAKPAPTPPQKKDNGKGDLYHHPEAPMKEGEIVPEHSSGTTAEEKLKKEQAEQKPSKT